MIDITQPIHIWDDRGMADEDITIDRILFQTGDFILCHSDDYPDEPILINIKTNAVLNEEYFAWFASN